MFAFARRRCAYVFALWREGLWGKWLAGAYAIAVLFIFIRDDWWQPANSSKWKIVAMIPHLTWEQWTLGALVIAAFWIFEASFRIYKWQGRQIEGLEELTSSPLEIIFDPGNSAHRFWSIENVKNPNKPGEHVHFHEYRIEVKNMSPRTVKNVRVIKEHTGALPKRPTSMPFDLTKAEVHDIHPGCSVLVPIVQWPHPIIQAGMLAGPSALEYGPIHVIASGDDVLPARCTFKFDYQRVPMIYN